jgi:hypothetical protein
MHNSSFCYESIVNLSNFRLTFLQVKFQTKIFFWLTATLRNFASKYHLRISEIFLMLTFNCMYKWIQKWENCLICHFPWLKRVVVAIIFLNSSSHSHFCIESNYFSSKIAQLYGLYLLIVSLLEKKMLISLFFLFLVCMCHKKGTTYCSLSF